MDHNQNLKPWDSPKPDESTGKGTIEVPGQTGNIVWQTRSSVPTEYETSLASALETVFGSGIEDLDGVVAKLNELGARAPEGEPWTVERFEAEMARLGF